MNYSKLFLLYFIFSRSLLHVAAQSFTAQTSKSKVAVGETFQISFTLNTNGGSFKAPSLNDFDIYSGPNQSSNMVYTNGNISQTISFSYYIAAKKEGKFTIGPATINTTNGTIKSNTLTIEVVKGNTTTQQQTNQNQNNTSPASQDLGDNLFIKTHISKNKVYLGEQVTLTFKIYTRVDILQLNVTEMPACDGFFMQDGKQSNNSNENIDGINYLVAEIKKSYLIPLRTGKITIDPIEVECAIRQQSKQRSRNFWDQFFGAYENVAVKIKSKPVALEVIPLPEEGKPENFSGAVGNYSMKAQLNKNKIKANESINLSLDITGDGNIKLIDPIKINFPEDFETYEPKTVSETISENGNKISGSKKFDYLIIPRYEGEYKIENIDFNYFDPIKKQYVIIPSPSFTIQVEKGDENTVTNSVFIPSEKEAIKIIGTDIRYIKTGDLNLQTKDTFFFASPLFFSGIIFPILAFALFLVFRKKQIESNKDSIGMKSKRANKIALKHLKSAQAAIKANNKDAFYIELSKALLGYISDKFNLSTTELNQENITALLQNSKVSTQTINQLKETIENCEFAKYAPASVSVDLNTIYIKTLELITSIEDEIK